MSSLQSLKTIIHLLQAKHILSNNLTQSISQHISHPAIFKLIVLIYNLSVNTRSDNNNARAIMILQELTLIIGNLTSFQAPVKFIATLQKYQFYEFCKNNKEFSCLLNKIFGLYPQINIEHKVPKLLQFDTNFCNGKKVGNPNWMLTRSIFNQWLMKNEENMVKPIVLSSYMLLSSEKLLDLDDSLTLWDEAWISLYLWLNTIFLEPFATDRKIAVTWCNFSNSQYRQMIKSLYKNTKDEQERIIFNLLLFVIEEFIFNEKQDNVYFKHSAQSFKLLVQPKKTTWQELLGLQIIKVVSQRLGHNKLSLQYEELIHQIVNSAQPQKSVQFQYLLPHLLPKSQVKDYIIDNSLQFWNYGLEQSINQEIAILYLKNFHTFLEQEQRINILLNLNRDYILQNILNSNLLSTNLKLGQAIVKVILSYPQKIGSKLYSSQLKLSQSECKKNIQIFAKQWDTYYMIHFQGIDEQNFESASQFLTFDVNTMKDYSQLPQKSPKIYYKVLNQFTDYFLETSLHQQDVHSVFLNPIFVDYFARLQEQQKDGLWRKWSNFMMDSHEVMQSLMEIDLQGQPEDHEFLTDQQIYKLRRNR